MRVIWWSVLLLRLAGGSAILTLAVVAPGCVAPPRIGWEAVMEPDDLACRLNERSALNRLIVLDVRPAVSYAEGHVAGAVQVNPEAWKDESLAAETGLDHEALWHAKIGGLGIDGRGAVIIYDDGRMTEAARVWFIFQHLGVTKAGVLNGGYPALQTLIASGHIVVSREATQPISSVFRPSASQGAIALIDRQQVRQAIERGAAQVLDARTVDEYAGRDLRKNNRGGHLPTALSLPHTGLLDESGRLRSPGDLAAIFKQAGLKRGQPVITHCDGGGRASLAALAAARAGYGPVMNYYLSFGDWAADATCPVEQSERE
jgi:thiosulfate/3-mercaptopyruvate sulfurtransferase